MTQPSPPAVKPCTGIAATWCPNHGDCACRNLHDDPDGEYGRTLSDYGCPLHDDNSDHAEGPTE